MTWTHYPKSLDWLTLLMLALGLWSWPLADDPNEAAPERFRSRTVLDRGPGRQREEHLVLPPLPARTR